MSVNTNVSETSSDTITRHKRSYSDAPTETASLKVTHEKKVLLYVITANGKYAATIRKRDGNDPSDTSENYTQ